MGIKQLFLILCCGLAAGRLSAQFPVQVMPQLTPPYSLQLNDYYNGAVPKLTVLLTDRDLTRPSLNVRLKMTIAGQSASISTIDNAYYPPITLDAGVPVRITGSELAPYFNPDNLNFQGITKAQYLSQGQLPEGYYQFCFSAVETTTGRVVSSNSCAMAWLDLSDPPLLNLPSTASNVAFQDPLNIVFSWTPRNSGNPNSAFSTTYDFQVVEITDTTVDPTGAFTMLPPLYTATTAATTLLYGPSQPILLTGHRYAWRVQAQAMSNGQQLSLFNNNGYSNVNWFNLEDNCQPPLSSTAVIENGGVHLSWAPQSAMLGYEVDYRLQGADTAAWFTEMATADSAVIYDVSPGQTYEYRIGGACSVGGGTTYGNVQAFTVPAGDTIVNKNCGILPNINTSNQTPLPSLNVGDVFLAGDFPVKVLTTSGGNGRFSGTGYVTVPFLGQVAVKVGWSGAGINTDHQLISGAVMTAFDATARQVADADSVAAIVTGFAGLINSLVTTPVDGSYQQIQQLEGQIKQMVAQQLPQTLVNQMDSALDNLNTAKLSYDSAKAVADSLPPGPAQDSAQAAMQQFAKNYSAAQQAVSTVMTEKDQLIQGVTNVILQAVANIRKEKDSLISSMAGFTQDVRQFEQSTDAAQGVDSVAADPSSMTLGSYSDDGTYDDASRSTFLQQAGTLIQRKRAYKGVLVYKLFTDYFGQSANVSGKLNTDPTVNGKDLIDQLITQQQANTAAADMVQFAHDYLVKALDAYIVTLNQ